MKLSMFGISISLFGIAWILSSSGGGASAPGLIMSLIGVMVCLFALLRKDN